MTISWYSIYIRRSGQVIFTGYFSVDNTTNLVVSFYETINGSTDFNRDIILKTGGLRNSYYDIFGFKSYYRSPFRFAYDNGFKPGWKTFWSRGVQISSMSYLNQTSTPILLASTSVYNNNVGTFGVNYSISPISDHPSRYVNDGLQLYNFLNSNGEQCIITDDVNVNSNLTSSNGIKTMLSNNNLIKITIAV